ncbi:acyl-CoA N-acyltransferase [Coniochaeta sp. PMI_546]|nr:acyl-CoA N-acyltransferase [Coniochaeta sp. PMI_546]
MTLISSAFSSAFRSDRLLYRAIEPNSEADRKFIYEELWSNPNVMGYGSLDLMRPISMSEFGEELEKFVKSSILSVLVCLPNPASDEALNERVRTETSTSSTPIGVLFLSKSRSDSMPHLGRTHMGILMSERHQGKAFGAEAMRYGVDWAFRWANMNRVETGTPSFNERALKSYQKAGFKVEGRTRQAFYMNGEWHDMINIGVLRSEWQNKEEASSTD